MSELQEKKAEYKSILNNIRSLKNALPYADHGSYGQDLKRIVELQKMKRDLENTILFLENENA